MPLWKKNYYINWGNGVGKRTLKRILLEAKPYKFSGVGLVNSRAQKPVEQHGCTYFFVRIEDILQLICNSQMIEWGNYNDRLYGTTVESVQQIVRSGGFCVLDCSTKTITSLYNSEFMPFTVIVAAPELNELIKLDE